MRLSTRARHAVRLTLEIYRQGESDRPVKLTEVARVTNISRRFLEQLAMALKSHSIIRGICGRNGGYVLGRSADEITVGDVLRAVTGPIDVAKCTEEPNDCMAAEFCGCRLVWQLLQKNINELLDRYTIADICDERSLESIRQALRAEDGLGAAGGGFHTGNRKI
jgi:Rrf2 family protein